MRPGSQGKSFSQSTRYSISLYVMDQHYGQIVERVIRRNGYSISELSRLTNVNRRSVYNWFNQQHLKPEIIFRIGCALKHDFSVEFPHLFSKEDFKSIYEGNEADKQSQSEQVAADNWKDKYIHLLEQYNNLLLNHLKKNKSL